MSALPFQSTAMQNLVVGHEMAVRLSLSMTDGFDHLSPLRVMVLPLQFAATQKLVVGQDTD